MATERLDLPYARGRSRPGRALPVRPHSSRWTEHPRAWAAVAGFREVLLVASVYVLYDLTRFIVAGDEDGALAHGRTILRGETRWMLAPEHALNSLFSAHAALAIPADYAYATLHYLVTPVVLVWLWRRHGPAYSRARTTLMIATLIGLVGYTLLPVAPPRMLPGFVDTMAQFSHWGWWGTHASAPRGFGGDTNEFAALPSLHVGWALWAGWQLFSHGRHRLTRLSGVAYPLLISVVVVATANHYLVDVLAGAVVIGLGAGLARLGASLAWRLWPMPTCSPSSSSPRAPVSRSATSVRM